MKGRLLRVAGQKLGFEKKDGEPAWNFESRPGGWVIASRVRPDGSLERTRLQAFESRNQLWAQVAGFSVRGDVILPVRGSAQDGGGNSDLVARFPGKVRKILVIEGQSVKEGEALLLVEAMKMEFSVKAPFSGVVTKLRVTAGATLSPGDRFLDLLAEEKP